MDQPAVLVLLFRQLDGDGWRPRHLDGKSAARRRTGAARPPRYARRKKPEAAPMFSFDPYSSIVDLPSTFMVGASMVKVLSWYDNEWGFSSRMCEVLSFVMK